MYFCRCVPDFYLLLFSLFCLYSVQSLSFSYRSKKIEQASCRLKILNKQTEFEKQTKHFLKWHSPKVPLEGSLVQVKVFREQHLVTKKNVIPEVFFISQLIKSKINKNPQEMFPLNQYFLNIFLNIYLKFKMENSINKR